MAAPSISRVLIVDDEESIRAFVEQVLENAGYTVVACENGPIALRVIEEQEPFDLYLLDVMMPQMQGDELARQIRLANPDAKILYLTGYADKLFETRAVLWAHEAFIEKPVTITGLLEAVALMLTGTLLRTG